MDYRNANWQKARDYFNLPKGWVLHHKDVELFKKDPERYAEWRIKDLVPMTISEHVGYHAKLRGDDGANKGKKNGMYGKKHTESTKEKMGKSRKEYYSTHTPWCEGKHWKLVDGKHVYY